MWIVPGLGKVGVCLFLYCDLLYVHFILKCESGQTSCSCIDSKGSLGLME